VAAKIAWAHQAHNAMTTPLALMTNTNKNKYAIAKCSVEFKQWKRQNCIHADVYYSTATRRNITQDTPMDSTSEGALNSDILQQSPSEGDFSDVTTTATPFDPFIPPPPIHGQHTAHVAYVTKVILSHRALCWKPLISLTSLPLKCQRSMALLTPAYSPSTPYPICHLKPVC